MSQHDMILDNAPGLGVRTDMNAAIQALASCSLGPIEPTVKYAGQLWLDTSVPPNGVMRQRDLANALWIVPVFPAVVPAGVVRYDVGQALIAAERLQALKNIQANRSVLLPKAANYLAVADDSSRTLVFSGAATLLDFQAAAILGADWFLNVVATTADITIEPAGAELIDARANILVRSGTSTTIYCDGTQFVTNKSQNKAWEWIGSGPAPAATSIIWTNLQLYRRLRLHGILACSVAGGIPQLTVSSNQGSTWIAGATDYGGLWHSGQNSPVNTYGSGPLGAASMALSIGGLLSGTFAAFALEFEPFSSAQNKYGLMQTYNVLNPGGTHYITNQGVLLSGGAAVALNALRVQFSTGVFGGGSWITLEGVRN